MISILGAGAIGQLLAHKLTEASVDCQFIIRDQSNYEEQWQINATNSSESRSIATSQVSDPNALSLIAVCVKAPQLHEALASIKHRLDDKSQLILFQNGMGHELVAQQFVPETNIFFASNTHGAFKNSARSITYAGKGNIQIGSLNSSPEPYWLADFKSTGLNVEWSNSIETALLKKLLINSVINPLAAIYQCKNGDLLADKYQPRLLALINENSQFAKSMQLDFATNLKEIIFEVLEKTADNYNSMLQDVQNNQQTEINSINGYLLDLMTRHEFNASHNWRLWSDFHISYPPLKTQGIAKAKTFDQLQYSITQNAGTERPFTGTYNQHNETGDYLCACCDSVLFDDKGKFDSGCGWPSFDKAKNNKAIAYRDDISHGMQRTEILCAQCGSHLGHVFDDGPTETGVRYCVNSASLDFIRQE